MVELKVDLLVYLTPTQFVRINAAGFGGFKIHPNGMLTVWRPEVTEAETSVVFAAGQWMYLVKVIAGTDGP